ncbi:MAG: 30S ribosomal protein S4 [Dehalococcoidales bacterium]|nr:30S ribosomal protein S4 [Dehalococcoidales bacterium]
MARYTDSVCKLCQRCNEKLMLKGSRCLTPKCAMERKRKTTGRRRRVSDRGLQLIEKQKVRYSYGVLERQFKKTFDQAAKQQGITGDNLVVLLEKRLDNVVYRLGFADSRAQARQLVQHGHITVNSKKVDIPSYQVKEGDTIGWRESSMKTEYCKQLLENIESKSIVSWLSLDRQRLIGQVISLPTLDEVGAEFDGQAVVEYYSR